MKVIQCLVMTPYIVPMHSVRPGGGMLLRVGTFLPMLPSTGDCRTNTPIYTPHTEPWEYIRTIPQKEFECGKQVCMAV
jgi:hypothetical protein